MRMPFGKHKGTDIRETPTEYLEWLLYAAADGVVNAYLADELKRELKARETRGHRQRNKSVMRRQKKPQTPRVAISAQDFCNLPENADDYQIALTAPVYEMAQAAERIRQRWEARQ